MKHRCPTCDSRCHCSSYPEFGFCDHPCDLERDEPDPVTQAFADRFFDSLPEETRTV